MLELKNISKRFGDQVVLDNLSVTIEDQKTLAIVGPSGAGKTTLLRIIAGLTPADSGSFTYNGQPTTAAELRKQGVIGVVFQGFELFPNLSVLKNITLAPTLQGVSAAAAQKHARNLMDQLDLEAQANAYPYSCRVVRSSGSRSPGRWPWIRKFCFTTSRPRRWIPTCASRWQT